MSDSLFIEADAATEKDVTLDLLAIIDEAPEGRLVGSEETTIEKVEEHGRDEILITLDNGQQFIARIREKTWR